MEEIQEISREQIVEEITKCRKDIVYFIENYCRIIHPTDGLVLFKMFDFQKQIVAETLENRFIVVLKGRQLGVTTLYAAIAAHLAIFHNAKRILIIANKGENATNFIDCVKVIIEGLPQFLRPKIKVDNRQSIKFINDSFIKASSTTRDAGRSEAVSLLIVDEGAAIPRAKEIWTAAYPTLSTGGKAVVLSTPKGVGNWFHETYSRSRQGLNEFHNITVPWNMHPERDEEWKRSQIANMGEVMFSQEHDCIFGDSLVTVKDKETNEILKISIRDLYDEL